MLNVAAFATHNKKQLLLQVLIRQKKMFNFYCNFPFTLPKQIKHVLIFFSLTHLRFNLGSKDARKTSLAPN